MKESRKGLYGILIVVISFVMAIGSIIAAIAEGQRSGILSPNTFPSQTSTTTLFASQTATSTLYTPPTATAENTSPTFEPTPATPLSPTPTLTPFQIPTNCPPPYGWVPLFVQYGDSLDNLANSYQTTPAELKTANCLQNDYLPPGIVIFVPNTIPTATYTQISSCGPPAGWVTYIVKAGDTLYSLGKAYGVTVAALQRANCLGTSTKIRTGSRLWVPNVPTNTPNPTNTLTKIPKPKNTKTSSPTFTNTPTTTSTETATSTPTVTPTPF